MILYPYLYKTLKLAFNYRFTYNDTFIECTTSKTLKPQIKQLSITFDNTRKHFKQYYNFTTDPNVTDVQPRTNIIRFSNSSSM